MKIRWKRMNWDWNCGAFKNLKIKKDKVKRDKKVLLWRIAKTKKCLNRLKGQKLSKSR